MNVFGKIFRRFLRGAALWVVATSIVILASGTRAWAKADLTVGASFRSYPLSGVLEIESGYGFGLWGKPQAPLSGYIRPRAIWSSAVTYNSLDAAVEFFPLAFLGVRGGGEAIQNDHKFSAYDCQAYGCLGHFDRTYFEGELTLGVKSLFTQMRWRRERWTQSDAGGGDFVDPTSGLVMHSSGDWQTVYYAILGARFNPKWSTLLALRNAESGHQTFSRFPFLVVRYQKQKTTMGLGGGVFESELKKSGFSVMAFLRWEVSPSLALH